MLRTALSLGLIASIFSLSCTNPSVVDIVFECPSPSGAAKAVFWVEGGGGAAGWMQGYLAVVAATLDIGSQLPGFPRSGGRVFEARHGFTLKVNWQDDNRLLVEYPDSAVLDYAVPAVLLASRSQINIAYNSVVSDGNDGLPGGSSCRNRGVLVPTVNRKLR